MTNYRGVLSGGGIGFQNVQAFNLSVLWIWMIPIEKAHHPISSASNLLIDAYETSTPMGPVIRVQTTHKKTLLPD